MKLKINSHSAFTLAEVLITLGIIGVVAALTIPVIISRNQSKSLEAGLKKGASVISQALLSYENDNGEPIKSDISVAGQQLGDKIIKYFKVVTDCGYSYSSDSNLKGCVPFVQGDSADKSSTLYKTLNGSKVIDLTFFDDRQFILADGSMIFLENNVRERTYISIDVNGYIKGPNRLGQDLFMFQLDTNGRLIPMGAEGTDYYSENDEYCSKTSTNEMNGAGCTYKALGDTKYFSSF